VDELFHVTSAANRDSIRVHGLDWTRMGAARGIAGSTRPEADGVFLCDEFEVGFFTRMNNTGGPVDVWSVAGVGEHELIDAGSGFRYYPAKIPPGRVMMFRQAPQDTPEDHHRRAGTKQGRKTPRSRH
jgi:hypothetical protein